jgi:dTDP-4-amino-4,6-dideoxygalactose transaminase
MTLMPGFKYTMTDIQASVGIHQVPHIDTWRDRRREIWATYDEHLRDLPMELPPDSPDDGVHARHLYSVLVGDEAALSRDQLRSHLDSCGIGTGVHYRPVHLHPWYAETFGYRRGMFPHAERIGDRTLSLPLSPFLSEGDVARVVEGVRSAFA